MTEDRNHKWLGRLKWFSSEFLVVVLGILFAFSINTWWEGVASDSREEGYLADLQLDFEENEYRLKDAVAVADTVLIAATELLRLESAQAGRAIGLDSLTYLVETISLLPTFQPVTRTYDDILGAGELQTIKNSDLRALLADFHSQLLLVDTVEETQERQFVQLFIPYIMEHLDYLSLANFLPGEAAPPNPKHAETIYEVLGTRAFRNWIVMRYQWAEDLQSQHDSVLMTVEEIRELLKAE
ncbi:hypothetical protein HQ496_13285 [bacterium]|nr:hypothetical protein [bacterium]